MHPNRMAKLQRQMLDHHAQVSLTNYTNQMRKNSYIGKGRLTGIQPQPLRQLNNIQPNLMKQLSYAQPRIMNQMQHAVSAIHRQPRQVHHRQPQQRQQTQGVER